MEGRVTTDGVDLYTEFGVFVSRGGYAGLISHPQLKEPYTNDWPEEHGVEADLSSPKLDKREFRMNFGFTGEPTRVYSFVRFICDGAYHDFSFVDIGREYRLRVVSTPAVTQISGTGVISVTFSDDFPLRDYTSEFTPPTQADDECDFSVGDFFGTSPYVPLSAFGVKVLEGTYSEITRPSDVKKNLSSWTSSENGVHYDGLRVRFGKKDVRMYCLMRASSLAALWERWNGLLAYISRSGYRGLHVESMMRTYKCWYKSCSVNEFYPFDGAWLRFTLTLVFADFKPEDMPTLLIAQDTTTIVTEDNNPINLTTDYGYH